MNVRWSKKIRNIMSRMAEPKIALEILRQKMALSPKEFRALLNADKARVRTVRRLCDALNVRPKELGIGRIYSLMVRNNLEIGDLALKMGTSMPNASRIVNRLEHGRGVSVETIMSLVKALGAEIGEIAPQRKQKRR